MKNNLTQIVDYILLKSMYTHDIGLFHGKMGIVLALLGYADRYKDKLLEEYAWDLFQQVYDGVHGDMPLGLENGLAGIGYATTWMCAQGWGKCDLNAVLAGVDEKIMQHDPRRQTDNSIRSGMGGVKLYLDLRCNTSGPPLTFDKQYLAELQSTFASMPVAMHPASLTDILVEPSFSLTEYLENPIGIDGGSAFYILKDAIS